MIEDDLGISDNNSFYLLYDFNKRNLSKPFFKPALDLGNMDEYYDDMLSYMGKHDLRVLNEDIVNIINEELMRFYQGFLGEETTSYITDSGILVGESVKGRTFFLY